MANGRDWGTYGEWAYNAESAVRKALESSDPELERAIKRYPQSVASSYSPTGKKLGWIAVPDWRKVLVLTEGGIGDPHTYDHVRVAFDRAVELLDADPHEHEFQWGWDSINPAVQYFYKTPRTSPRKAKAKRNPGGRLTYGNFYDTGMQDCGNALDIDSFDLDSSDSPEQIVDSFIADWDMDEKEWIDQTDMDERDWEGLDPQEAYKHWRRGWRGCAIRSVTEALAERKQRGLDDLELFYLAGDDDDIIESFGTIEEAVTELAKLEHGGAIKHGDGNGPDYTMYKAEGDRLQLRSDVRPNELKIQKLFRAERATARARGFRPNPASSDTDADEERAVDKYIEFNRLDPKEIVTDLDFEWPTRMRCLGDSTWVTYRSRKIIPDNMVKPRKPVDYIHEHDEGVKLYVPGKLDDVRYPSEITELPKFIRSCKALALLGECTGFGFRRPGGAKAEANSKKPLPELYCTPDGRALVVIQGKRELLAIMFGGALGVEGRGIVG